MVTIFERVFLRQGGSIHLESGGQGVGPQEDDEELEGELEQGFEGGFTGRHPDVHPNHPRALAQQETRLFLEGEKYSKKIEGIHLKANECDGEDKAGKPPPPFPLFSHPLAFQAVQLGSGYEYQQEGQAEDSRKSSDFYSVFSLTCPRSNQAAQFGSIHCRRSWSGR